MLEVKEIQKMLNMIYHYGRPLEEARVKHLFFEGPANDVLMELSRFQNPDGGFGHGLEPDLWNPNSSPIQCWVAINILREMNFDRNAPLVNKLVDYLENAFDEKTLRWPLLIPSNDDYPHAPWWSYREMEPQFNPSASIAGFLIKYTNPLNKAFKYANKVAREAIDFINTVKEPIEFHELICLIEMMNDVSDLFKHYQPYLDAKQKMILIMEETIEKDASKWFTDYCVKPSFLIHSHPSIGSELFFDRILEELDLAVQNRNEHGLWSITWNWDGNYPGIYEEAASIWEAIIALGYLKLMYEFGYIKK
jgi:hypothetical protein